MFDPSIIEIQIKGLLTKIAHTQDPTAVGYEPKYHAYYLSMPLLTAAFLNNELLYKRVLTEIVPVLDNIQDPAWKAWLEGRVLIAAKQIHDTGTYDSALLVTKSLLPDKGTEENEFTAWAWGYLASASNDEFNAARNKLLAEGNKLSDLFHAINQNPASTDVQKQAALSNALWVWVMNIQAVANADKSKDNEAFYHQCLNSLKSLTGENTVEDALSRGLLRTEASNDYPAWAMAIVRLSAALMKDHDLYNKLDATLAQSIDSAVDPYEKMLGQVYNEAAINQHAKFSHSATVKMTNN
jgi:hypothetical protein